MGMLRIFWEKEGEVLHGAGQRYGFRIERAAIDDFAVGPEYYTFQVFDPETEERLYPERPLGAPPFGIGFFWSSSLKKIKARCRRIEEIGLDETYAEVFERWDGE